MRVLFLLAAAASFAADLPSFRPQTIADDLRGGYQVVVADLNRDGKPDLIALASGMNELVWFENPGWTRHVLARGLTRMINCAVIGDDIVVAHEFNNEASKSAGIVSVLHRPADPRDLWSVREIDRLPTSHRLRVAEIDGRQVVINAPLTGAAAAPPDYKDRAPLVYYRPGEWKRETIPSENMGVQHGIFIDGRSILTASFSGIHRFQKTGGRWKRTEISKGDPSPCPKCGSSDVAVMKDGALAAIEPWHGNQVVVYRGGRREVIDDTLADGHSIAAADLDGDGKDEIIVAQRGAPGRVIVYRGKERTIVDEGITAASCVPVDLDGDRRIDLACIGSGSHNLKVYWNRPAPRAGEWIPLIEANTLNGWRAEGKADWRVEDGTIVGRQGANGAAGDLFTEQMWSDFDLEAEWRMRFPGNSGIWFRVAGKNTGYQADILDEPGYPGVLSGSLYCMGKAFIGENRDALSVNHDGWNKLLIHAEGDRIEITQNERKVISVRDGTFPGPGSFGIQVHSGKAFEAMQIRVRNIRVRPIAARRQQ